MNAEEHARRMIRIRPSGPDKMVAESLLVAIEALQWVSNFEWGQTSKTARLALAKIRGLEEECE